mmetsp:Transcript_24016/g.34556  ORF Transcript_24016/g.34556 Transcript_24016/m.34556 type:complete len:220 (-) Transcript_24016:227-886(-)
MVMFSFDISSSVGFQMARSSDGFASGTSKNPFPILRTATVEAIVVSADKSAPTYPAVFLDKSTKSKSSASRSFLDSEIRIWLRPASSGAPISSSRSNLPALLKAGSIESGLFVAPRTITGFPSVFSRDKSSIQVSSCATILLSISLIAESRREHIASTSSINNRHGAFSRASSNRSRNFRSESPDIPETISGAEIFKYETPSSPAIAEARSVFPHPGGP